MFSKVKAIKDKCSLLSKKVIYTLVAVLMIGIYTIIPIGDIQKVEAVSNWWNSDWDYVKTLTFDNSDQTDNLTNFTALVILSSTNFDFTHAQTDGDDIRFVDSDNTTELDYDIEYWNSGTESAVIWVEVPQIDGSSATDYIYMYYGNDAASAGEDESGAWSNSYTLVAHLDESSGTVLDAAGINSGTNYGATAGATGHIKTSYDFANTNYIDLTGSLVGCRGASAVSMAAWIYIDATNNDPYNYGNHIYFESSSASDVSNRLSIGLDDVSTKVKLAAKSTTGEGSIALTSGTSLSTATWYYVVGVIDVANDYGYIYVNGALQHSGAMSFTGTTIENSGNSLRMNIGSRNDGDTGTTFLGNIDELQIVSAKWSADWIAAEYLSQTDGFITYGSEATEFTAPTITNGIGATNVASTTARLNGELTDSGGASTQVTVYYGDNDGGTTAGAWDDYYNMGVQGETSFYYNVSGLTGSTNYYYRFYAVNTEGSDWADSSETFLTDPEASAEYEEYSDGADADYEIYSDNWVAQLFTVGDTSHSVSQIRLYAYREGYPSTITVSIKAVADDEPVGEDLTSGTLDGDTLYTSSGWISVTISDYELSANTTYAIVVKAVLGDVDNSVHIRYDSTGAYTGGSMLHSTDGGDTWGADATYDVLFQIWGASSLIDIENARVFSGYIEDGDMLIVMLYNNVYVPYYPDYEVDQYFTLRLTSTDGNTVYASTPCLQWGYSVGSIYLSADSAARLTEGSAYRVYMYGTFTGNPTSYYTLTTTDWKGTNLDALDSWVVASATAIENYTEVELMTYIVGKGKVLNEDGGVLFATGIMSLTTIRPDLFQYLSYTPEYLDTEWTDAFEADAQWETRLGDTAVAALESAGDIFGISGKNVGIIIVCLVCLAIFIVATSKGASPMLTIGIETPIILISAWVGLIGIVFVAVIYAVLALFTVMNGIWSTQ